MTPEELAGWMVQQLAGKTYLYQSAVANHARRGNPELVYRNRNRNWALVKPVLEAFRKLTPGDEIVWSRSMQLWRHRKAFDKPGRMQK